MKRNKRFYHWIKLQRKYRTTQKLLVENNDNCLKNRLTTKLDRLSRRLRRLNEKWRIGISAAALTAWMAVMPAGEAQAQRTQFTVTDLPGTQIIGENTYDQSGYSVSTAGDINGDGIEDFIISAGGARIKDATSKDIAYVVFGQGSATPTTVQLSDLDGSNGFALIGEGGEYSSDGVVSEAGDLNGDGIDDLAVSQTSAGEVYVVFGKDVAASGAFASQLTLSDLDGTEGFKLLGENVSDETGVAMSSIEDINGDDISDLIIGASRTRQAGRGTGTTYVVFGKNTSVDGDFPASLPLADLDGTNGFELLGDSEGGYAGGSVSSAGDVNGDGHTDLIVGASGLDDNANRAGGAYVVFGKDAAVAGDFPASMDLSALDGSNGFKLLGENKYDGAGGSVSGAGDVNGDGIDDFIIGADGFDVGGRSTGSVFVIFGKNTATDGDFPATFELTSVDGANGFELVGESEYDALGRAVSEVGDVNGDGVNDLFLGTSRTSFNGTSSGSVYVVFGKNTSVAGDFPARLSVADLDINTGYRISGEGGGDGLGTSVSNVGDVNQDGIADLLVGAPRTDKNGPSSGTTYVVFGRSTTALLINASISDATAREEAAFSFVIPEETFFNPEGTPLTLSATQQDGSPLPTWLSFDPATRTFSGTPAEGDIGQLTIQVTANDTNDPSISDVFTLTVINKFAQLFANLSVLTSEAGFKLLGANENDFSGNVVSAAGDINGDGIDDMLVSAYNARRNGLEDAGAVYVVFGQQDRGSANEVKLADLDGTNGFELVGLNAFDRLGESISAAGDVNGDGVDDLMIGATGVNNSFTNDGTTYVVFGKDVATSGDFPAQLLLDGLDGTNGFTLIGEGNTDESGNSVSSGDINGDGISDLIIGAPEASVTGLFNSGITYVVYGKDAAVSGAFPSELPLGGLDGTTGFKIIGGTAGDESGTAVSSGDFNGDGIDDVLIGASDSDVAEYNAGAAYVFFGRNTAATEAFEAEESLGDLDGTNGFGFLGENEQDALGRSLSTAGDINGDGIDDFIVGVSGLGTNGYASGGAYVIFGKNTTAGGTFPSEIDLENLADTDGFQLLGETEGGFAGRSVSSAGDINGDGLADLLIGANGTDLNGPGSGTTYVIFGRRQAFPSVFQLSDLDNGSGFKLFGEAGGDELGRAVSGAGDINGDAIDDLIVGARGSDLNGSNSGTTYVIFGQPALAPVLARGELVDAQASAGTAFTYQVPAERFIDPEGGTLTLSAALSDGNALPAWLAFDPATRTFSGTPANEDAGNLTISVTATDGQGLTVSDDFALEVIGATDDGSDDGNNPDPLGLEDEASVFVYPNPTTDGLLRVEGLIGAHQAVVYSLSGAQVLTETVIDGTLNVGQLEAGSYLVTFKKEGQTLYRTRVVMLNK